MKKQQLAIVFISIMWLGFGPAESEDIPKVSWDALSKIDWVLEDGDYLAKFTQEIERLDGKTVEIMGFMFPLSANPDGTKEFLLSANPVSGCFFCAPGSSNSLVMIYPESKIDFQFDAVVLEGTLELVPDDFYGLVYQMKNVKFKKSL